MDFGKKKEMGKRKKLFSLKADIYFCGATGKFQLITHFLLDFALLLDDQVILVLC